ncbi:flagellar hook-associated protein FlgL [Desulfonatronospira sp.]|uniref:flagellar hook-associated protein FlgL n=1 Tax=Desulfonatronospira sp. TaxID=1962951 RepID=UPI0025C26B70|nr:flagellar hook-associated protein FlgL [Desulfonatronospira sp.]
MRVSHNMMYHSFLQNMNRSTTELMELHNQASSQKKVNKPSDDPVGMFRILGYRDSIAALDKYQSNVDTAKGWLNLADETLIQANNLLIRAKELAEQGATGTLSPEQREIVAGEVQQVFNQMINLANTRYEGKSIFGGHKTDDTAFEKAMWVTSNKTLQDGDITEVIVQGRVDQSIKVEFRENDDGDLQYRFSEDGTRTWSEWKDYDNIDNELTLGSDDQVVVKLRDNFFDGYNADDLDDLEFWVRPTAEYKGDDEDRNIISAYTQADISDIGDIKAIGRFENNVTIRIDDVSGNDVTYSYSQDGGSTWNTGNTATRDDDNDEIKFLVPGGRLQIDGYDPNDPNNDELNEDDQIVIRPNKAAINFEISSGDYIQVNNIGKDVFGGIYKNTDGEYVKAPDGPQNVFETLGELIGYLETDDEQGIQKSLENIDESLKHISAKLADVGARENRLAVASTVLSGLEHNEKGRMSNIEDVDIAELMSRLASRQMTYEAVLRSSSLLMQMSLVNHI